MVVEKTTTKMQEEVVDKLEQTTVQVAAQIVKSEKKVGSYIDLVVGCK